MNSVTKTGDVLSRCRLCVSQKSRRCENVTIYHIRYYVDANERKKMETSLDEKISWMRDWAERNGAELTLNGSCGFFRDCVGIRVKGLYPDYNWYDDEYNRVDTNGEVWSPDLAYHKHPCVAVLGHGTESIEQLYMWIQWFDNNGFVLEQEVLPEDGLNEVQIMFGKNKIARMVKK